MNTLSVSATVLREAKRPLRAKEIVEIAGARIAKCTASKTPHTVVARDLAVDVKKPTSAFERVSRGLFQLKRMIP